MIDTAMIVTETIATEETVTTTRTKLLVSKVIETALQQVRQMRSVVKVSTHNGHTFGGTETMGTILDTEIEDSTSRYSVRPSFRAIKKATNDMVATTVAATTVTTVAGEMAAGPGNPIK